MEELTPIIVDWLQRGEQFVLAEAPDVARELIIMGRVRCALGLALVLVGVSVGVAFARLAPRLDTDSFGHFLVCLCTPIATVVLVICGLVDAVTFSAAIYAPKAYLFTQLGVL